MNPLDTDAVAAVTGPFQVWVLPALLGLGLASATGLRTFLPLLMLGLAARFDLFGIGLNEHMSWIGSTPALAALAIAAIAEFAGDKVPVVDHALSSIGLVARPIAGALAAGSVFAGVDPTTAAIAGIIIGAPTALAFNAAQGGARVASTATTGGLGNPILSFFEDILAFFTVILAFVVPILIPVVLLSLLWLAFRSTKRFRRTSPTEPAA